MIKNIKKKYKEKIKNYYNKLISFFKKSWDKWNFFLKKNKYITQLKNYYNKLISFFKKSWDKWKSLEKFDIYKVKYDFLCKYHKRFRIYIYTIISTYIFEIVDYDFEDNVQICTKFVELRSEFIFWIIVIHFFFWIITLFRVFQCFLFTYIFFIKESMLICLVFDAIIIYCFYTDVYFFSTSPIAVKNFLLILALIQIFGIISILFFELARWRFKKYLRKKWKCFFKK